MSNHTSIEHSFKCTRCGTHKVTKATFDAHITPAARDAIAARKGVTKVRLVFHDGCPVCLPQGETHTRIADVQVAENGSKRPTTHITP